MGHNPDIMAVGKSISSGIAPLAATIASPDNGLPEANPPDCDVRGTPVACAVADATIHLIHEEKLATRAQNLGLTSWMVFGISRPTMR